MNRLNIRKWTAMLLVCAITLLSFAICACHVVKLMSYVPIAHSPTLIAHRGDTIAAPENSLKSIVAAGKSDMDYAEIDVRLTSDGKPVLFHDRKTGRLSHSGIDRKINKLTYRQLGAITMGSNDSSYTVPSLRQAIIAARQSKKLGLLIDLKTDDRHALKLVRAVAKEIERYDFSDRVMLMATSRRAINILRTQHPSWRVGWCLSGQASRVSWCQNMDFVVIRSQEATQDFMDKAKARNVDVYVGGVSSGEDAIRALQLGARGILGDDVRSVRPAISDYLAFGTQYAQLLGLRFGRH